MKLTARQQDVLRYVYHAGVVRSGYDGKVLRALAAKGLVHQYPWAQGQNTYYTWRITDAGIALYQQQKGSQ